MRTRLERKSESKVPAWKRKKVEGYTHEKEGKR
jgi:hypothetical protein